MMVYYWTLCNRGRDRPATGKPLTRPLYSDYLQLVEKLASKLASKLPPSIAVDDLIQEGNIGLLQAIERYDPKKNDNFPLYARHRIMGAMLDSIRCRHWFAATLAGLDEVGELQSPLDLAERTRQNEIGRRVYTATRQLTPQKRRIVQLLYVDGLTQAQIAKRLHIGEAEVETLREAAVGILRLKLKDLCT